MFSVTYMCIYKYTKKVYTLYTLWCRFYINERLEIFKGRRNPRILHFYWYVTSGRILWTTILKSHWFGQSPVYPNNFGFLKIQRDRYFCFSLIDSSDIELIKFNIKRWIFWTFCDYYIFILDTHVWYLRHY